MVTATYQRGGDEAGATTPNSEAVDLPIVSTSVQTPCEWTGQTKRSQLSNCWETPGQFDDRLDFAAAACRTSCSCIMAHSDASPRLSPSLR